MLLALLSTSQTQETSDSIQMHVSCGLPFRLNWHEVLSETEHGFVGQTAREDWSSACTIMIAAAGLNLATNDIGMAQVDLEGVDHQRFPRFATLPFKECILGPGEALYMPPGYWHFVKSLDVSFSVTFWWR